MVHDIIRDMLRRVADLERRQNSILRPSKIVDIDETNYRVRVEYSTSEETGQPVISPWIPWTERAGNTRTWNPPTVGEQVHLFSPSGEIGMHSWVMAGGFSDQFKPSHNKRDEQRETTEVTETKNHLPSTQPGVEDKNGAGPTNKVTSTVKTAGGEHTMFAEKDDDDEQTSHEDLPGKAKKLTSVQQSPGQRDEILEDKEAGTRTRVIQSSSSIRLITKDENGESEVVMSGGGIQMKCKNMTFDASESTNYVGQGDLNLNPSDWPAHPDAAPAGDWEGV